MSEAQQDEGPSGMNRLGGVLVGLAVVAVVVAHPPPFAPLNPFFGVESMFLPLIASVASFLLAIVGGVFLARGFVTARTERAQRLLVHVLVPVGVVAVISVYLFVFGGFVLQSPFIIGAVVLAIVAGIADEFTS